MASKVRVYELAREFGIPNADVLELCKKLGIGVKSHSSSIVEAQADRVRRKAEREGLKRVEPVKEEEPPKKKASADAKPSPKSVAKEKAKKPVVQPETVSEPVVSEKKSESSSKKKVVSSSKEKAKAKIPLPPSTVVLSEADVAPHSSKPKPPVVSENPAAPQNPISSAPAASAKESAAASPVVSKPKSVVSKAPVKSATPIKSSVSPEAAASAKGKPSVARPKNPAGRGKPPVARPKGPAGRGKPPVARPKGPVDAKGNLLKRPIPPPPPRRKPASSPPQGRSGSTGTSRPSSGRSSTPSSRPSRPANMGFSRPGGAPSGGRPGGPPSGGRPGSRGPNRSGPNRGRSRRKSRRKRNREELMPMGLPTYSAEDAPVPKGVVVIERSSTPQDLGPKLNRTAADVVRFLLTNGDMVTATQSLSDEMIELFAVEVGAEVRLVNPGEEQEVELQKLLGVVELNLDSETLKERPPVVTVMGHVDHGKTKLLDRIRSANVVDGEAGGITQHIGAYQIERDGKHITFLDTPGHEAFTAMRARGANATDIVILVVAADDGVMPQTLEALDHARAAEVPIIVAINKIDREAADPQRVMTQLAERNLIPEAWGGDTIMVEVSALKGDGIDNLIDTLLLVAEVEDLKADPQADTTGIVLESHLDIGRGSVATVLVEQGTLRVGDPLVAGAAWGRIRALVTDRGEMISEALPSTPVQVLGLNDVASAGDKFVVAPSEKVASKVASTRSHWQRLASLGRDASTSGSGAKLEDIFAQIKAGEVATLNLIVKADVNGSLEAVCDSLKKLERDEVKLSFVMRGVGGVTRNDVQLAAASNATILGFNVRPDREARNLAAQEQVEVRNYEIIYKLIEDIEKAMLGLLAPEYEEVVTGEAEVREIFKVPKLGAIAGCMVTSGVITRGSKVRFLRDGTIIWKGAIQSLKRFKEDAKEVTFGFECGIGLSDFQDLKEGDVIETFTEKEVERTLSDPS